LVKNKIKVIGCQIDSPSNKDYILNKLESYKEMNDIFIQVFNVNMVLNKEHILWAYDKAKRSLEQNTSRADSLEIETLLWASGERQIKNAIKKMGVPDHANNAAVLTDAKISDIIEFLDWERDDAILEPSKGKLKKFDITDEEINSVENPYDLIFEKLSVSIL